MCDIEKNTDRQTPVMTSTTLDTGSSAVIFPEKEREKATQNKLWMITLIQWKEFGLSR
jgi:hypothetical protein